MSILNLAQRPWVTFDPTDSNHRSYYLDFLQNNSWRQCPVQFSLERGYGDLAAMIENKLAAYYLGQEFHEKVQERGSRFASL